MIIHVRKFGEYLNGRPDGREAALRVRHLLQGVSATEPIILDFTGVFLLVPGFADEFLEPLRQPEYRDRVRFEAIGNEGVQSSLDFVGKFRV